MEGQPQKKLLIVDDSELNRAILGELFKDQYEIVEAENGREAIDLLEKDHAQIAALLLDIVMPVLDGFGVLEFLAKSGYHNEIPVFLITAETSGAVRMRGYESGVVDVIAKPITDPNIVVKRVNNAVELFAGRNDLQQMVNQQVKTIKDQADRLRITTTSIIDMLSSVIEFRSGESGQHVRRVRESTRMLLEYLSRNYAEYAMTPEMLDDISDAAAMHDIGKISIPDYILNKPGRLAAEEFEEMKKHTIYGCQMLEQLPFFKNNEVFRYAYDICRSHHERWDGRGYPDGLVGDNIPIWAQTVSIADVYDALVSKRVYKDPYPPQQAVEMIRNGECGTFNPILLAAFLKMQPVLQNILYTGEETVELPVRTWKKPEAPQEETRPLSDQVKHFHQLAEDAGELLFEYNYASDTVYYSDNYSKIFGDKRQILHAKEHLGWNNHMLEQDSKRVNAALKRLTPEKPVYKTKLYLSTAGGRRRWFQIYVRTDWNNGKNTGFYGRLTPTKAPVRKKPKSAKAGERKAF